MKEKEHQLGYKIQKWPDNVKIGQKRNEFNPYKEEEEKRGKLREKKRGKEENLLRPIPIERWKRKEVERIGQEMSSSCPQAFKFKYDRGKVKNWGRKLAEEAAEMLGVSLPDWGETTRVRKLGLEIIPRSKRGIHIEEALRK